MRRVSDLWEGCENVCVVGVQAAQHFMHADGGWKERDGVHVYYSSVVW